MIQQRGLAIHKEIHLTDGCAAQYKSIVLWFPHRKTFLWMQTWKRALRWCGAMLKSVAGRSVMEGNTVTNNATELYNFAKAKLSKNEKHSKRTIILVNNIEHGHRPERENAKPLKGIRKIQCARPVREMTVEAKFFCCFAVFA